MVWIGVVSVVLWRFHEKIGNNFPNAFLRQSSYTPIWFWVLWSIRGCIFVIIMSIWMNLRISSISDRTKYEDWATIIALDISKSMQSDDVAPSRLDNAKNIIHDILEYNISQRIWLIVFAGKTFLMSPPVYDTAWLIGLLKQITTDTIDQSISDTSGSNIGDALIQAMSALEKSKAWKKHIILITDGRANIWIDPLIALEEAKKQNITIYTVWIWNASWASLSYINSQWIRQYFYDTAGNTIQADRDDTTLTLIATRTWGKYLIWNDKEALESIIWELKKSISHQKIQTQSIKEILLTPYLIFLALLLSIIHGWLHISLRKKYNL